MGPKAKISVVFLLIAIVALAVWELTSPQPLPSVGTKYTLSSVYANKGGWVLLVTTGSGRLFLGFSVANLTFPRSSLSTTYSLVISKANETVTGSFVRGVSLRVTDLRIEDNYDGVWASWGKTNALPDAVQVTGLVFFRTAADHQLRFTVTYEVYQLFLFGYAPDHSETKFFNITQTII